MKRLILLIAAFAALHTAAAAERSVEIAEGPPLIDTLTAEPYLLADPMPSFNGGGTLEFCRWVQERLRYPREAVIYGIEGHVVVSFVVEADGRVSNAEVLTSPDPTLSEAALFVVRRSPRWAPGQLDGRPVRVKLSIPIDFNLQLPGSKPPVGASLPNFQGGGLIDFKYWVLRNVEFPDKTFLSGDEGWVEVSFSVNGKGKVREVETTRFSDPDFAYRIQRTIASSPLWTPAGTDGQKRSTDFRLRFDLLLLRGPNGLYSEDNTAYTSADSLPRFCGGSPGVFREWVFRQVDSLLDPGAAVPRVRVNVRFIIERDGTMSGIKVSAPEEQSGFAKLVRLAVDKTPLWTPPGAGGGGGREGPLPDFADTRFRARGRFRGEPRFARRDAPIRERRPCGIPQMGDAGGEISARGSRSGHSGPCAGFVRCRGRRHGLVGADHPVARPDPLAGGGAGAGRVAQMDPRQQERRACAGEIYAPGRFPGPGKAGGGAETEIRSLVGQLYDPALTAFPDIDESRNFPEYGAVAAFFALFTILIFIWFCSSKSFSYLCAPAKCGKRITIS